VLMAMGAKPREIRVSSCLDLGAPTQNPDILMMQPAEDWNRKRCRRPPVRAESSVPPCSVIESAPRMSLTEHDDVVVGIREQIR